MTGFSISEQVSVAFSHRDLTTHVYVTISVNDRINGAITLSAMALTITTLSN
jgi:hypothetical protein